MIKMSNLLSIPVTELPKSTDLPNCPLYSVNTTNFFVDTSGPPEIQKELLFGRSCNLTQSSYTTERRMA